MLKEINHFEEMSFPSFNLHSSNQTFPHHGSEGCHVESEVFEWVPAVVLRDGACDDNPTLAVWAVRRLESSRDNCNMSV